MNEGSHTIVITQIAAQTAGVIFLDYIMYNTSSSTVHPYFIDDRDPRIKYTAAWRKFGSDPDFQHTSQGSTFAGDSFSLPFEGKSISYYGGINNGSVGEVLNASIVIDGGPPTFFVPGVQPDAVTTNNLIFNSGDLSEGNHTLVVTAENDHTVWTDYFLVTPNTRTPTSNTFPLTSGPSSPTHRIHRRIHEPAKNREIDTNWDDSRTGHRWFNPRCIGSRGHSALSTKSSSQTSNTRRSHG
ncbi:hypothetical protein B0H14DRAFT_1352172 [Mycena olivaceomarginata]|nr:hypothetical protein B0H14DRAFT_1352172 [Mycena olivaceomarginata]